MRLLSLNEAVREVNLHMMTTEDAGFGTGENSAERAAPLAAATAELPADKPRLVQVTAHLGKPVIQAWPGLPLRRGRVRLFAGCRAWALQIQCCQRWSAAWIFSTPAMPTVPPPPAPRLRLQW